jgi:NADPH:quinone reductase-like Zn-dependent oxidoreductase
MSDMQAVQFDRYGDIDVLDVRAVPRPVPQPDEVLVQVRAAGINPGEAKLRNGMFKDRWPSTFPSGQGSDFAGAVTMAGAGVRGFVPGDEVFGYVDTRSSHAEFVAVPATQIARKPPRLGWEVAGALGVVGRTAVASVRALGLSANEVVAVSAAAGGVGALAVQLLVRAGVTVLAIAGPSNDAWLSAHGAVPVNHGPDLARRLAAASPTGRIDAFLDLFGAPYVELAIGEIGVAPSRVDTIIDFAGAARLGAKTEGSANAGIQELSDLAALIEQGAVELPIAKAYKLAEVRDAFRDLESGHTRGKIVLVP